MDLEQRNIRPFASRDRRGRRAGVAALRGCRDLPIGRRRRPRLVNAHQPRQAETSEEIMRSYHSAAPPRIAIRYPDAERGVTATARVESADDGPICQRADVTPMHQAMTPARGAQAPAPVSSGRGW